MLQSFVDIEYQVGKSKRGTVVKQWRLTPVDPGSNLVKGSFYSQLFRKRKKKKMQGMDKYKRRYLYVGYDTVASNPT